MKWNNHIIAIFFFFAVSLLTRGGENSLSKIDSNDAAFQGMDGRLRAISANPELLNRLDQQNLYRTPDAYHKMLNRGLSDLSAFAPGIFSSDNRSNLVSALCVYDARVFFWLPQAEQDVIGWITLPDRSSTTKTNRMFAIWIVPHKGSSKEIQWASPQQIRDSQFAEILKGVTGKDFSDLKRLAIHDTDHLKINGLIVSQNRKYQMESTLSGKCLQIRMSAIPEDQVKFPGKPVLDDEPLDLTKPIALPFWPPKETNEISQTGIGQTTNGVMSQASTNIITK